MNKDGKPKLMQAFGVLGSNALYDAFKSICFANKSKLEQGILLFISSLSILSLLQAATLALGCATAGYACLISIQDTKRSKINIKLLSSWVLLLFASFVFIGSANLPLFDIM